MILQRTQLFWDNARIWLETADESIVVRMEYQHGELVRPAHLRQEQDDGPRRREEIPD